MFDYLQKYQQIPADIRAKLDTPAIKAAIKQLETNYHLTLAGLIIKIVVKDVLISRLSFYLSENYGLSGEQAQKLTAELQAKVLVAIHDYLAAPLTAPIDINRLAKSSPTVSTTNLPIDNNRQPVDLESTLNKLVSQQIVFKLPAELDRWRQVAKTFLLGVRNQKALDDFLIRSFVGGGLGVSLGQAQELKQQLTQAKELLDQQARQQVTVQAPAKPLDKLIAQSVVRDFESDLLASLRKINNQPRTELKTETELLAPSNKETKLLPTTEPVTSIAPAVTEPLAKQPLIPATNNLEPTIVIPVDQRSTDNKTGKIRMDDVRFAQKTSTPLDEIANLNLKRFRYLGHDAQEQAQKVKEKLDLLAEYGYSKRLQGISAWRQSPLNRMYLQAGQSSIASEQSAEQLLTQQANQNTENLTFAEFIAIMNLNQQLRF
jgi:hypothetical protein